MFGEINPKMVGKVSDCDFTFDALTLTSAANSSLISTGALILSGSSLSIGRGASPIQGNPTELNFGQSFSQRMICLYDNGILGNQDQNQYYGFGLTAGTFHYSVGTTGSAHKFYAGVNSSTSNLLMTINGNGAVSTSNNTLDDGGGTMVAGFQLFSKGYSVAKMDHGFYLNDGSGPGGANYLSITGDTLGSMVVTNKVSSAIPLQINGSTNALTTIHNTLDDGSAGFSLATSGSAAANIGTGTYTGQITIGNTSNNLGPLIQGGTASNAALTINSTSGGGCYTYVNRSGVNAVAFGSAGASRPIDIYDFSATSSWLYNNGTHGNVSSAHNVLDDGSGGCSIATSGSTAVNIGTGSYTGTITLGNTSGAAVNCNNTLEVTTAGPIAIIANGANVSNISIIRMAVAGIAKYDIVGSNTTGSFYITNSSGAIFLQQSASSASSLLSANNTLDDGSGNMTLVGTGDPILRLRRSSYSTNFVCRIKLVDDNTSGKYWEIGTDVSGNQGGDLYFYGQGSGALGLAMQLTAKGYLYLGYTGPWFQTTVTTPSTGNQTITAAHLLTGIVVAPITSSAFTWTTDTGTNIYSAMGSPATGTTFTVLFSNANNSAGAVMTIAFGTGVSGNLRGNTLNNNQSMVIYFRCTGTNTFTCYS